VIPKLYMLLPMTGAQVRAARAFLGWNQTQLCRAAGISRQTLNDIERNTGDPRRSSLNAVQNAFAQHGVHFTETEETVGVYGPR